MNTVNGTEIKAHYIETHVAQYLKTRSGITTFLEPREVPGSMIFHVSWFPRSKSKSVTGFSFIERSGILRFDDGNRTLEGHLGW